MNRDLLLPALFPQGFTLEEDQDDFFRGTALVADETVLLVGSRNAVEIGVDLALRISAAVLTTLRTHPGRPVVLLLDTQGQRLRRRDELLGLNGYMAHVAKVMEVARGRGHPLLSLVYGQAVSGGYLTSGMMADAAFALEDAEIKVMNLPAMARITKIPLERLEALAQVSPVFSPGAGNYFQMGHIDAIWKPDPQEAPGALARALADAIAQVRAGTSEDARMQRGAQRGGRTSAEAVARAVRQHA